MPTIKYAVVYEAPTSGVGNWSSYVPDLPGCVSVGDTLDECRANMAEAIGLHVRFTRQRGGTVPEPSTHVEELEVAEDDHERKSPNDTFGFKPLG